MQAFSPLLADETPTLRALLALEEQLAAAREPTQVTDAVRAFVNDVFAPDVVAVHPCGAHKAAGCATQAAVLWGDTTTQSLPVAPDLLPWATCVTVPLVGRSRCHGEIFVSWSELRAISSADTLRAEVAGRRAGAALDHLHLLGEQQQQETLHAQLADMVTLSGDAIIGIDLDGIITSWDAAAERLYGYAAAAIVGRHCTVLVPEDRFAEVGHVLQRLRRGERVEQREARHRRQDGSTLHILVSLAPLSDHQGRIVGATAVARDITNYRNVERAHDHGLVRERAMREQIDTILGGIADGVLVQREDGTIVFANDAAARIAGFESVDAYHHSTATAISRSLTALDADGQPFSYDQLPARRAFRGEVDAEMVVQFRRDGTGEVRWARTQSRIVRDAGGERLAISIFHDITDEVRARDRLRFLAEAGAQLTGTLDLTTALDALVRAAATTIADWAIVMLLDDDGTVGQISSAHRDATKAPLMQELYERQLRHASGARLLWEAVQKRETLLIPVVTDELMAANARNPEHLALLRQLELRSLLYAPLLHDGHVRGAIALFMAGSGRSFGEEDRAIAVEIARRASLALEHARIYDEMDAAVQARDEFLSIASHELRTPVTAISGIAQVALRSQQRGTLDGPRLTRILEQLIRGSQRLVTLTEDLLDVSRLQTGRFELRPEQLDLSAFVVDFAERFAATLTEPHRLILHADDGPLVVHADPARLEQVLANLLSNAVKYAPDGGNLTVVVTKDGERAACAIQDEGIGLPPGAGDTIFQPFGRAANAARRHIQGLGLGLYICRQIMERHGGGIVADSDGDGCGTTMRLWLPLVTADEAAADE